MKSITNKSLTFLIPLVVFALIFGILLGRDMGRIKEGLESKSTITSSLATTTTTFQQKSVRKAAVAGMFYPKDKKELEEMIEKFLNNVKPEEKEGNLGKIKAIIVPHAGYVHSGQIAAFGFGQLSKEEYETVIILAPSHYSAFRGASIINKTHYETPLGEIKISADKTKNLLKGSNLISSVRGAHDREHAIEVELPFLQKTLQGEEFEIIPLLISQVSEDDMKKIALALRPYVDTRKTLIVVSSDFTHQGPRYGYVPFNENVWKNVEKLDLGAIEYIKNIDPKGFWNYIRETGATICGKNAIYILLEIFKDRKKEINVTLLSYKINKFNGNSVSYASIVFHSRKEKKMEKTGGVGGEEVVTEEEKKYLLKLARETLESYIKEGKKIEPKEAESENLKKKLATFVTLEKHGQLRGCMGHLQAFQPLYLDVRDNSIAAAIKDPRFPRVREEELRDIEIEISILTTPELIKAESSEEYLEKIVPLRDGIIIERGPYRATYLPQVWEQIPEKKSFLGNLCRKANLEYECWKDPQTKIYRYSAIVFSERNFAADLSKK
jgi:hypothetical protein